MSRSVAQLERAIEAALRPGEFVSYKRSWEFVSRLEEVAADINKLVGTGQPADAATIFETFIAAAHEKAEEIDDSSGGLGMFVVDLFCDWVRARQAAKAKPEETVELVLTWMDSDEYGFCHELERDLVKVMNKTGLRAFAAQVRARLEASAPDDRGHAGYPRRRWTAALKRILAAQGDAEGYVALAEETAIASQDCCVIAGIHERRGDLSEALAWVERGLALVPTERYSSAEYELERRQRALLMRLGRADEAVASAWAEFERSPSEYSYQTLMEIVPEAERPAWHDKAMAVAERGDLGRVVGLLVETREVARLAARVAGATDDALEGMSHHTAEPAAELLAAAHPALAARVFRALGLRIVNAKKSKYYDAALENFARARDCYLAAGQRSEWEALVTALRREHGRKYSFMPGLERLADGGRAVEPRPSFLERARSRWPRAGKTEGSDHD